MKDFKEYHPPQALVDFLNYMQTIKGKSPNTVQGYFYDLRLFFRFILTSYEMTNPKLSFEDIDISVVDAALINKVTLSDLYSFVSFVTRERDNTSYARARKVASLKSFFNYAHSKAKIIENNPAAELESPKIVKRLPRYLEIDESKQLLSSVDGEQKVRNFAILTLFLNCGMRLSELVSINIKNIRGGKLSVIGKGDKERVIYLNQACQDAVDEYLKVRPRDNIKDKNALFLSKRKQRISNNMVQRIVKRYIQQAGLDTDKYSTHKLRHTAATLMYKYGNVDIRALQDILGHESISTTEIYTHLDEKHLKAAVDSNPLAGFSPTGETKGQGNT